MYLQYMALLSGCLLGNVLYVLIGVRNVVVVYSKVADNYNG